MRESTTPATSGRILASRMVFRAALSLLLTVCWWRNRSSSESLASAAAWASCSHQHKPPPQSQLLHCIHWCRMRLDKVIIDTIPSTFPDSDQNMQM